VTEETTLTIGEVARLAHVSVRTLHHYDRLGLLRPSARSEAGYRLYSDDDLGRLQQILLYRELGFGLRTIAGLLADPGLDRAAALARQRELLEARRARLEGVIDLVDATLASLKGGPTMTREELFEVFGDFDPNAHEEEVRERWGGTDAYAESRRRTAAYSAEDWRRYRRESDELNQVLAALMDEQVLPGDTRAQEAVERHRLLIDRWFYLCSPEMHAALGEMYAADPRFAETFDAVRPGLARYLRDAAAAAVDPPAG
jgi:DNA-binding transcriptional MerR regulator